MFGHRPTELRLRRSQPLALTALEQRCVPATTALFVGGSLAIFGDDGNQNITVTEVGSAAYRVDGLTGGSRVFNGVEYLAIQTKRGTDSVTLVGGQSAIANGVTIGGFGKLTVVNNRMNINALGGGFTVTNTSAFDVSVFVQPGTFLGKGFSVTTGLGNDSVVVGAGAEVYGGTLLRLGGGSNNTVFSGAVVEGNLTIAGAAGTDVVELANTKIGNFKAGYLDVTLGGGSDVVRLLGTSVKGNSQVVSPNGKLRLDVEGINVRGNLGVGASQVTTKMTLSSLDGRLWVTSSAPKTAPGIDNVHVDSCLIGGDLRVQSGMNYQYLSVRGTTVGGNGMISASGGALCIVSNTNFLSGVVVDYLGTPATRGGATISWTQTTVQRSLSMATGAGNDEIRLNRCVIGPANPAGVSLFNVGGGNDLVDCNGTRFHGNVRFDGGPGVDTLRRNGAICLGMPPVIINFESVS